MLTVKKIFITYQKLFNGIVQYFFLLLAYHIKQLDLYILILFIANLFQLT